MSAYMLATDTTIPLMPTPLPLATITRLTTIAHLASIALSPAFATPCPSPLTLKVSLRLISSLLPMRMFHFSCCFLTLYR